MAGFDVAPPVAHDVAGFQIDIPDPGRFEQQARLRLPARATRRIVVRADADTVQLQETLQALVHFGDLFGRDQAARDVGLIGDQDERETGVAQSAAGFANAGQAAADPRAWRAGKVCLGAARRGSRRRRDPGTRRDASLDPPQTRVGEQRIQRHAQRLARVALACPAESADAIGVQPHDRNVAFPAAIAAGVFEAHLVRARDRPLRWRARRFQ